MCYIAHSFFCGEMEVIAIANQICWSVSDSAHTKASIKVSKNIMPFIRDSDVIWIKYIKEADVITVIDIEF